MFVVIEWKLSFSCYIKIFSFIAKIIERKRLHTIDDFVYEHIKIFPYPVFVFVFQETADLH